MHWENSFLNEFFVHLFLKLFYCLGLFCQKYVLNSQESGCITRRFNLKLHCFVQVLKGRGDGAYVKLTFSQTINRTKKLTGVEIAMQNPRLHHVRSCKCNSLNPKLYVGLSKDNNVLSIYEICLFCYFVSRARLPMSRLYLKSMFFFLTGS